MAKSWQTLRRFLGPKWLVDDGSDGRAIVASWLLLLDAFTERAQQGLTARFPATSLNETSLVEISADRGILRGRTETAAHYAQRLIRWRYPRGHRTRGNAFALLEQMGEYFGGWATYTIDARGNRYDRSETGVESRSAGVAWDWDALTQLFRFWAVTVPPVGAVTGAPDFGDPELWGGTYPAPDYAVGLVGITPSDARAIAGLCSGERPWRPHGVIPQWWVISLDGTEPEPTGDWGYWSEPVAGLETTTWPNNMRFVALDRSLLDYAGEPQWTPSTYLPDGTTYTGSAAWSDSYTLPDGSSYTGDPDTFPDFVTLFDDGSPAS